MSIIIFDNLLFFPQGAKTMTLETKNFLHFLLEDEYFQNELKTLRKKYKIPEEGYHIRYSRRKTKWQVFVNNVYARIMLGSFESGCDILFCGHYMLHNFKESNTL